ncbi:unnamed protein product [Effrenium voratum]|uniref:Uncharacterized protein n=1 Tax=Effrenium voratum TaxID=2562239 RepID=A0AA36HKG8_9DINO|nr:unnamed protein product [Effrenium voratum]CAJ1423842.1 unnamed protein product [Effrenium voratum]
MRVESAPAGDPQAVPTHGDLRQLRELRATLRRESLERRRLEECLQPMLRRLGDVEAEAARLGGDLRDTAIQREELQRQISERHQSVAKLQQMCRKEQETRRRLDSGLLLCRKQKQELEDQQLKRPKAQEDSDLRLVPSSSPPSLSHLETSSPCSSAGAGAAASDEEAAPPSEEGASGLEPLEAMPFEKDVTSAREKGHIERDGEAMCRNEDATKAQEVAIPSISQRDLSELKALKKPPVPVRMLMEICCMLFGIPPEKHLNNGAKKFIYDYWEPARRFLLSDSFFLPKIRALTPSQVSAAQRARIRRYFQVPDFTAERVRNCSKAALELYCWVRSLVTCKSPASDEQKA